VLEIERNQFGGNSMFSVLALFCQSAAIIAIKDKKLCIWLAKFVTADISLQIASIFLNHLHIINKAFSTVIINIISLHFVRITASYSFKTINSGYSN